MCREAGRSVADEKWIEDSVEMFAEKQAKVGKIGR